MSQFSETAEDLRSQAVACRRLAASASTPGAAAALIEIAEDYERRAERLEGRIAPDYPLTEPPNL
ncbi:MAG TPA: hypothetical protein VNT25_00860 [Allosphingosinicella sp.]|nr:hypothetical protein [Allosphingosinicella sp.]